MKKFENYKGKFLKDVYDYQKKCEHDFKIEE